MIQQLMIINRAGIALFYHNFSRSKNFKDHQSLASYFDLLCRFTKNQFKESLRTISLDNSIFFFYTHQSGLHIIFKCDNESFDRELLESLADKIIDNFIKKFKNDLKDFNGEISNFHGFSQILEKVIDSKDKDIKKIPLIQE
ncbi:MAG: hypothetical protein KAT66_06025 [Candidatus Lokiarchaeota archaeon]|nr:hypothetical protein [Candidatus Lokiarchaeota archaeon]